jgi:allene oxide cyclase-like protein
MTTSRRLTGLERRLAWCTTFVILAAASVALAAARGSLAGGAHAAQARTLHYGVTFVNDSQIDLGARGPSVGDERTFYDVLSDNHGKRTGYEGGVCTVENMQPPVFSCSITFSLPGGQIATQLLTTPGPAPKPFAITGGSGSYRNARGEGTLVEYGKHKGSITFHLTSA